MYLEYWLIFSRATCLKHQNTFIIKDCNVFLFVGVYTGSIYPDKQLYNNGFLGEMQNTRLVSVIKTHEAKYIRPKIHYEAAIILIRNPHDTLLSGFNFWFTGYNHTGHAERTLFTTKGNNNYLFALIYSRQHSKKNTIICSL